MFFVYQIPCPLGLKLLHRDLPRRIGAILLTPCFSGVKLQIDGLNRLSGFSSGRQKPLKRFQSTGTSHTPLKRVLMRGP
jgi:hypothetical protein